MPLSKNNMLSDVQEVRDFCTAISGQSPLGFSMRVVIKCKFELVAWNGFGYSNPLCRKRIKNFEKLTNLQNPSATTLPGARHHVEALRGARHHVGGPSRRKTPSWSASRRKTPCWGNFTQEKNHKFRKVKKFAKSVCHHGGGPSRRKTPCWSASRRKTPCWGNFTQEK
jgi:hypothetical protein